MLKFVARETGQADATRYRAKSMQRYGMIAAAMERKEKARGVDQGSVTRPPQREQH
jgi:hypothetical protein